MFCVSRWVYAGSPGVGAAVAGAARAPATRSVRPPARSRRMAGQRATGRRGYSALLAVDPLEQEDRDLTVGLLLVLGVRRVLRDRPLPPLRALVALGDTRAVGVLLSAVLEVDLGVVDEVLVPRRVLGRPALGGDRGVHTVVLDPHHRVLAQLARLRTLRRDHDDGPLRLAHEGVRALPVGRLELLHLLAHPVARAGLVLTLKCHTGSMPARGRHIPRR